MSKIEDCQLRKILLTVDTCSLIGYNLFATQCGIIFVTAVSSSPHHSHTPPPSHPQSGRECVRYGDLDLFLLGLQLGDLLPLFQSHRVKFSDLLSMTDRDLEQVRPQHSLSLSLPSLLAFSLPYSIHPSLPLFLLPPSPHSLLLSPISLPSLPIITCFFSFSFSPLASLPPPLPH